MVKHFMIGLLPELLQQVKYEGVDILEDVICIAEKKEASLESTPIIPPKGVTDIHPTSLRASSSTNTLHPSNTPSRMEVAMEQLVSQMTQLSIHLLQPRTFRNSEWDSNKVQCYSCKEMGHISRDCPNHEAMEGPSSRRVTFADDKGKGRVNLVEIQDETREKTIANFEQSLRKEVDVMAAKRMQEESQPRSVKRMKEMTRNKGSKKSRRRRLDFHDFPISQNQCSYSILDDVEVKKADITIGQLVAMVPSVRKELRKSLSAHKVSSILHSLNTIAV